VNIDKDEWLQFDRVRISAGTNQFPADQEAIKADDGRHIALARMIGHRNE
jgi:hypothetical protein